MTNTPQKEDGFTPIANEIMEALMKVNLSAYESRVLWFLFRKTYGWNKKTDWITLSQFSACIGLDRRLIHRAIKSLSSKKMIVIDRDDTFKIRYGFQKDFKKWKLSSKKMTVINRDDRVSSKEMTRLSSIQIPTKETITKETIQKKRDIKRFMIPTVEEITIYCTDRKNTINPQVFIDHYMSNGWMVGKNKMKDWKAAVRTWEGRDNGNNPGRAGEVIAKTGIAKSDGEPYPIDAVY